MLRAFEESGRCRRGYFVEGLGGAQFALPGAVDRMRAMAPSASAASLRRRRSRSAARRRWCSPPTDPANPYGAALPWPDRPGDPAHRPGRKAGALVVLVGGRLALYVERGGKSVLSFAEGDELRAAVEALAAAVRERRPRCAHRGTRRRRRRSPTPRSPPLLEAAGFHPTPRGLRLRA